MRVIFGDESTDFERHWFENASLFQARAGELLKALNIEVRPREMINVTALLPNPRSDIHLAIARELGSFSNVRFAETSEFRQAELSRWFACYPPHILIGSKETLEQLRTLHTSSWRALQATISIDNKVALASERSYLWNVTLTHSGVEQHVD